MDEETEIQRLQKVHGEPGFKCRTSHPNLSSPSGTPMRFKTTLICIRNTEFMFNLIIISNLNSLRSLINIMPVKNELNR